MPLVAKEDRKPAPRRKAPPASRKPARNQKLIRWALLFVASLIVVDGLVGERGLLAMLRAQHEYDELNATIVRQRTDNARLRDEARRLADDPATIEAIARRDLGLIRPGEKLFIIKDLPKAKP
jgi:cell division protein FtsB